MIEEKQKQSELSGLKEQKTTLEAKGATLKSDLDAARTNYDNGKINAFYDSLVNATGTLLSDFEADAIELEKSKSDIDAYNSFITELNTEGASMDDTHFDLGQYLAGTGPSMDEINEDNAAREAYESEAGFVKDGLLGAAQRDNDQATKDLGQSAQDLYTNQQSLKLFEQMYGNALDDE